ncbi:S24 family peptidase [Ochrobactrum sp. AP1BH01-1]|uniref:S24 family peptidase n=1 Tax=Ochrobactrum sp. AP1BH01-1 TaxID=2823874 RepID=UPI00257099A0|nr:S24 family peptidase [Ochrobactrum sp. AP1BH01-1]
MDHGKENISAALRCSSNLGHGNWNFPRLRLKGVALDWLINGEGEMSTVELPQLPQRVQATELEAKSEFTLTPRFDVQASAGAGRVTIGENPLEYLAFQSTWLRSRNINPAFARILTARGDSMEETIRDGDVLLVDASINRIRNNTIYLIVYGDMVLVKRVHGRLNGSLQLICANPRYPAEEVSGGGRRLSSCMLLDV